MPKYYRNDIYFCPDCLNFHDRKTGKVVDVPYSKMPAEVALQVMTLRMGVKKRPKDDKHK